MITTNSIDYECIERTAEEIAYGYKTILRLPEIAEKGRILGGQNAIEASLVMASTETTNRAEPHVDTIRTRQETLLEEYAKYKNIWVDYSTEIAKKWEGVETPISHLNFLIIAFLFTICCFRKQNTNLSDLQKKATDCSLYWNSLLCKAEITEKRIIFHNIWNGWGTNK